MRRASSIAWRSEGSWSASAFPTTGASGINQLNGHYDHHSALPAAGNTTGDTSDLFTTADLDARPGQRCAQGVQIGFVRHHRAPGIGTDGCFGELIGVGIGGERQYLEPFGLAFDQIQPLCTKVIFYRFNIERK